MPQQPCDCDTMEPELRAPPPTPKRAPPPVDPRLHEQLSNMGSRLAVLEERLSNLRKQTQLTEQTLIQGEKETRSDFKAVSGRLMELARKVEDVRETIDGMHGELSSVVKKYDFQVLKKYMDYWEPLQFLTRQEAKLLIEEAKREK